MSAPPATADHRSARPANRLRRSLVRLLAALHRWAESGWSGPAVGVWGLLQGSVVPGPSEALFLPLGVADPPRAFRLALWAVIGSSIGGIIAYVIGAQGLEHVPPSILNFVGLNARALQSSARFFDNRGWLVVLISTVSPLSTKLTCVAAGSFGMPFGEFSAALVAGRGFRYLVLAAVVRIAGDRIAHRVQRFTSRSLDELR